MKFVSEDLRCHDGVLKRSKKPKIFDFILKFFNFPNT